MNVALRQLRRDARSIGSTEMDHPLTPDEANAIEALARETLRSAASAPDAARALAWTELAAACLHVVTTADRSLRDAGRLLDIRLGDAPFANAWKNTLTPIAARSEALLSRDVDREVDDLADRLSQP